MAKIPVHRLKKDTLIWMSNHTCKHRKSYLEHYNCYLREQPDQERVAIFDIETSNLDADFGIILTWCIKPLGEKKIISGVISPEDIRKGKKGDEDRRVVKELVAAMQGFDKFIGYYSKRYDAPYIRARAVHMGIPFPHYGGLRHIDVYDIIRHRFKISRKRQETACRFLLGHTDKTHFDGVIWRNAARGDKDALKKVLEHNIYDVQDLEKLYLHVINYARRNDTSI